MRHDPVLKKLQPVMVHINSHPDKAPCQWGECCAGQLPRWVITLNWQTVSCVLMDLQRHLWILKAVGNLLLGRLVYAIRVCN